VRNLTVLAGILMAPLFATMVGMLTLMQFDFLRTLGWDPLKDPTHDWPSGLSLGPHGGWMTATFLLCGLLLIIFAIGLKKSIPPGRYSNTALILLVIGGLALMGEAFPTDPTSRSLPPTWHGILHDAFFAVLGLSLMPAMLLLGIAFQGDRRWRGLAAYTWLTAASALPAFFIKGVAFYFFLGAVLLWSEVIAWRLKSLQ
jgi:hypothetical protein